MKVDTRYFFLIFFFLNSTLDMFASQIKAQLIDIEHSQIGEEFVAKFIVLFPDNKANQIDFENLKVNQIENQDIKVTKISMTEQDKNITEDEIQNVKIPIGAVPYEIYLNIIAKNSGLLELPPIIISIYTITFPYVYVEGSDIQNMKNIIPVFTYIPYTEILQILLWLIVSVTFIIFLIKVLFPLFQMSNRYFYNLSSSKYLRISIKKINKIEYELKKMGKKGVKKYFVTRDCYERLISIIRKSVNSLYQSNKGDTSTPEELYVVFKSLIHSNEISSNEIASLFETFDVVLYGKKKISVKLRIQHCAVAKQLLRISFTSKMQNTRIKIKMEKQSVYK